MPPLKPLLVFGLRGTLLERIHVSRVPEGMPAPDLTVSTSKIWLRPHMKEVLHALQPHCRLAIWSSTTARNTHPIISAVFETNEAAAAITDRLRASDSSANGEKANGSAEEASARGGRFSKKIKAAVAAAAPVDALDANKIHFEFVWTREHTRADDYRRVNASVLEDSHATVKDLTQIFSQFPEIAQPENTVLIDDTPSKAKMHADNYLWLDTCELMNIAQPQGMLNLQEFVMKALVPAKDVREVLCRRVRN